MSDDTPGPSTRILFSLPESGRPQYGDIPFPSDLYRSGGNDIGPIAGFDRVLGANATSLADDIAALDGFARAAGAQFFVEGAVDPASLPTEAAPPLAAAALYYAAVDPASPDHGRRLPAVARYLASLSCISVLPYPGTVLEPGVRYALVVTTAARSPDGSALSADRGLARIIELAATERRTAAEKLYGDALDDLVASGHVASAGSVAGLAVFTTSRAAAELPALRDRLRTGVDAPAPQLLLNAAQAVPYSVAIFGGATTPSLDDWLGLPTKDDMGRDWPGADNPTGIAHDAIAAVASGAFVSPSFLDPATGRFARAAGEPGGYRVIEPGRLVPVTIIIPTAAAPPGGHPVVVTAHGLGGSRVSLFAWANEYARAGFVVIGIDNIGHGARSDPTDRKNNFKGRYDGPDGLPDNAGFGLELFAGFNLATIRDNFRQNVLDEVSLVRVLQNPALDLSPLAAAAGRMPRLDPARIVWSGSSLGGMLGAMATAVEPELKASSLQVPGGGFIGLLSTNSARVHVLVGTLAGGRYRPLGDEPLDSFHPLPNLMAQVTEAGDPLAFAPHIFRRPFAFASGPRPPANVLITYATDDETMPNLATHALMRAMGIPLASPAATSPAAVDVMAAPIAGNLGASTGAAVQYAPSTHGLGYMRWDNRSYLPGHPFDGQEDRFPQLAKPIRIEMPIREHGAQVVHFFTTALRGTAEIIVTRPAVADFDNDGVPDEQEIRNGTDPYNPDSP